MLAQKLNPQTSHFRLSRIGLLISILLLILTFSFVQVAVSYSIVQEYESNSSIYSLQGSLGFNGTRAFEYLEAQCDFGPRPPGSDNLTACGDYIVATLESLNWSVQTQTWTYLNTSLRNIMAGELALPRYVLLAHYDTRPIADSDPDPFNRSLPILGANDGGSGVATLMELAEVLPNEAQTVTMLLFVDAEDSGNYNEWDWIVGSTHFVASLSSTQKANIQAAVLLDMMGDADLQLPREQSSTPALVDSIWQVAADLNYDAVFLNLAGPYVIDDHRPFLSAGIAAVDIIDFSYPYWHTLEDTPDKCSPNSLETVGRVIEAFMEAQLQTPTPFTPTGFPFTPDQLFHLSMLIPIFGGVIVLIVYKLFFHKKTE
ncbi:MAG: M28 family peptidase [Promethearchaeota archaeon]